MTKGERRMCDYMYGKSGGFYSHLWEAIFRADTKNLTKLGLGFPEEVVAYRRYINVEGYWDELETKYLG